MAKAIGETWTKGSSASGFCFYWRSDPSTESIRWRVFKEPRHKLQFRTPGWYWYTIDQTGVCDKTSDPVGPFPSAKAAKAACETKHMEGA